MFFDIVVPPRFLSCRSCFCLVYTPRGKWLHFYPSKVLFLGVLYQILTLPRQSFFAKTAKNRRTFSSKRTRCEPTRGSDTHVASSASLRRKRRSRRFSRITGGDGASRKGVAAPDLQWWGEPSQRAAPLLHLHHHLEEPHRRLLRRRRPINRLPLAIQGRYFLHT